jgi:hypothetical protein
MKYDIAVIASTLMVTVLIGASYLDSERTAQHVVTVRATVSSFECSAARVGSQGMRSLPR